MATCDLSIELEDPDAVYTPGSSVRGTLVVRTDEAVKCRKIVVRTEWRTHGRGNTEKGKGDSITLPGGELHAGLEQRHEFELFVAEGPSTFSGKNLHIDHLVHAQVDVPWGFDPKAKKPFRYVAPGKVWEASGEEASGCAKTFVVVVLVFMAVIFMITPLGWILAPLAAIGFGVWWFLRRFLPARMVGEVTHTLHNETFSPGERVKGEIVMHPPRDLAIEDATLTLKATESVTSGHGTNSSTYTHALVEETYELAPQQTVRGREDTTIPIDLTLPDTPAYTVELSSNKLTWSAELRISVARWPDWVRKVDMKVVPPVDGGAPELLGDDLTPESDGLFTAETDDDNDSELRIEEPVREPQRIGDHPAREPKSMYDAPAPAVSFEETADLLIVTRDTPEQQQRVIESVRGVPMPMAVRVQRREFFGGRDEHSYEGGYSYRAVSAKSSEPITLYVRHDQADDFEQLGGVTWEGTGEIVGYCDRRNRVLVRVL